MTPQEKAKQLFDKYADEFNFDDTYRGYREQSKQCALIAVQEIINSNPHSNPFNTDVYPTMEYWLKVKKEIDKL
jgi:hypothetical protein